MSKISPFLKFIARVSTKQTLKPSQTSLLSKESLTNTPTHTQTHTHEHIEHSVAAFGIVAMSRKRNCPVRAPPSGRSSLISWRRVASSIPTRVLHTARTTCRCTRTTPACGTSPATTTGISARGTRCRARCRTSQVAT